MYQRKHAVPHMCRTVCLPKENLARISVLHHSPHYTTEIGNTSLIITGHQMAEELARAAEEAAEQPEPQPSEQGEVSPGVQPAPVDTDGADISELAALANEAYENALKAMSEGDFVSYAQYIELMAKYVQQMVR